MREIAGVLDLSWVHAELDGSPPALAAGGTFMLAYNSVYFNHGSCEMAKKKRAGRPKSPEGPGMQVGLRVHSDFLAKVDEWRAKQAAPLSRPQAINWLAGLGLKREGIK